MQAFFISAIFFAFIWVTFGYYYGWVDDIWFNQIYRGGIFAPQPQPDIFPTHRGYSRFFSWAYTAKPKVPWYGLTHYLILFWASVNFSYLLLKKGTGLFFIGLFFIFFLAESLISFVFTDASIFLSVSAVFLLFYDMLVKGKVFPMLYTSFCATAAFFLRPESLIITAIFFIALALLFIYRKGVNLKMFLIPVVCVFLLPFLMYGLYSKALSVESKSLCLKSFNYFNYIPTLFDAGYEIPLGQDTDEETVIVRKSLKEFFFYDKNIITHPSIPDITYSNPLKGAFKTTPKERIAFLKGKISHFQSPNVHGYKYGCLIILHFLVIAFWIFSLIFRREAESKFLALTILLLLISFWGISYVVKYEFWLYRSFILLLFLLLMIETAKAHWRPVTIKIFSSLMLVLLLFQFWKLHDLAKGLKNIAESNSEFISSVRTLPYERAFFDLFSATILSSGLPLKDLDLSDTSIKMSSFPDLHSCFCNNSDIYEKIDSPSHTLLDFYDFLSKHGHESIMIYANDFRPVLYSRILQVMYDKQVCFEDLGLLHKSALMYTDFDSPLQIHKYQFSLNCETLDTE